MKLSPFALIGKDVSRNTVIQISALLNEESPLPYHFDRTNYRTIENIQLKEHNDLAGLLLYEKGQHYIICS